MSDNVINVRNLNRVNVLIIASSFFPLADIYDKFIFTLAFLPTADVDRETISRWNYRKVSIFIKFEFASIIDVLTTRFKD
jgi:hypothetical protein